MEDINYNIEKIRQQFDAAPYPRIPLDDYPTDMKYLILHSMVTAYYLRYKKVVKTEDKVILDAGCGSGFKSLALAVANPGAKIIGIDLSGESTKLATQRLQYHGFENVEFYPLSIYDLSEIGMEFDYIHCDETLYLLPDIVAGLQAMKSVLKPEGIIRANLHSFRVRIDFLASQKLFNLMGLMDGTTGEEEIAAVRQTMDFLRDEVFLKKNTWRPKFENDPTWYLANYLLQGDRGYSIPEMFAALKAADLEFINMADWHQWNLTNLFKDPENIPLFHGMPITNLPVEEQLYIHELLHPVNRLLDFWCGHPNVAPPIVPAADWTDTDWQNVLVHIHPSLKVPEVKQDIFACVTDIKIFEVGRYAAFTKDPNIVMDSAAAAVFLPLLEEPQLMPSLVQRWIEVRPLDPVTLEPMDQKAAYEFVKQLLIFTESLGFVLLEKEQKES